MSEFKWNAVPAGVNLLYNPYSGKVESRIPLTDKEIVSKPPQGISLQEILKSLCNVVSELVELEEKRGKSE